MHPPEDPEASDDSVAPHRATVPAGGADLDLGPDSYFDGRVALVTGGGSGIGAIVARLMAICGARVIVADIDGDRAKAVAGEIDGQSVALDVADPPSWDSLSLETPPTIAFLNVGVFSKPTLPYDVHEVTRAEVTRAVGANFLGVLHGLRRLTPAMTAVGDARICLNASWAGLSPMSADPLYTATKHAVLGLGRSVAAPLSAKGVTITMLCASGSDNPLFTDQQREASEQMYGRLLDQHVVAQAGLDILEYGRPGEIRVLTPERYARALIRIDYEPLDPSEAFPV